MNNVKRHQFILKKLTDGEYISVSELCDSLSVSSVTIRKDLQFLENSGLLYRTHGGATLQNPYQRDRPVFEKEKIHAKEKERIAQKAAQLIEENDSIIIASGTTMQYLAKEIIPKGRLTVVTSALNVSQQLLKHSDVDIIQLGGSIRHSSNSVTGQFAEETLHNFFCSKLFLGVDGIDEEFGLTTTNAQEAQLNRKMIAAAQKVIVLADSSKFGRKSFGKIVDFCKIDVIITDYIPKKYAKLFESLQIEIIIS